ncbi:MAG: ChaN family lipoprotein [Deltaproteobacteria bacterium]|nr:ChaN family lipoprotein [Deltaproteobacteria bacterium]
MKRFFQLAIVPLLLGLLLLAGCAPSRPRQRPFAEIRGAEGRYHMGEIIDLHQAIALEFPSFVDRIPPSDLVFVGEIHDNAEHHLIQVQILQALMSCCGPVDLAMEFFRTPQQPVLDRYTAGEITESEFLEAVDWEANWGFPFHLYRPLLALAREHGSRVLALNVPLDLVRRVARVGLEGLSQEERAQLPRRIDLTNEAHREYVRDAYLMHGRAGIPNFQYFYEAQCVYEEVMAKSLARYFEEAGRNHRKVVAFAGNGHLEYRFGIPDRVLDRVPMAAVTVLPYPLSEETSIPSEIADFVWLTAPCKRMPSFIPRMRTEAEENAPESAHDGS